MSRYCFIGSSFGVLIPLILSVLCLVLPLARAEQRELGTPVSENVDAILVLDGSGSMLKTDPKRLRDEGAKLFFQFLKPGDRLGIIEFSGDVKTIRPLANYQSSETAQIAKQLAEVKSDGHYTDLLAAVKTAHQELKSNFREDAHQLIVVLSDGKIEPDPLKGSASLHANELVNLELPSLKADNIKVHTLYFSEEADKDILSQIALGSDGVNWFTPTADKVHESFAELFLVVKKPQIVPLAGKSFVIDSDISEATFYITRDEGATVKLESPDGTVLTSDSKDPGLKWYSGTKFEVITVEHPKTGKWRLTGLANADGFATVLTDLKLITEWPSSFNAQDPITLQARLYEEKRPVTLPQMTGVVRYAFQIIPTDKISEPIMRSSLVDNGKEGDKIENDGIYSKTLTITDPGDYRLTIVAKGPTFTRHQQIPFRVKPRLITLRIAQESAHGAHADVGHGADEKSDHPQADRHGDEHAETESDATHKKEDGGHGHDTSQAQIQGAESDVIQVLLSQEASALKSVEVKLAAVSGDRRRFVLPTTKVSSKGEPLIFQAPATLLPGAGAYHIEASLTGVTSRKEHVHAESEVLEYVKNVTAGVSEEAHLELVTGPVKEEPPSVLLGLLIITIVNGACAAGVWFYLKKILQGGGITLPTLAPLEPVRLALAGMHERVSIATLNLHDPLFSGAADTVGEIDLTAKATQEPNSEAVDTGAVADETSTEDAPAEEALEGQGEE